MARTGRPTLAKTLSDKYGWKLSPSQAEALRRTAAMLRSDRVLEMGPDGKTIKIKGTYRVGGNWGEFDIDRRGRRVKI